GNCRAIAASLRGPVLAQISANLVERAGRDLGAIAQGRHQLAVVDDETAEGGLCGLRRAAEFPDLAEDLLGGPAGAPLLMFFDPHGVSARFPSLIAIKERPLGDVNHKRS